MKIMVYDAEIKNAIPTKDAERIDGIDYCRDWADHTGMGVSVICAYVWGQGYRVFLDDNKSAFKALAEDPEIMCVGFNNHAFDDKLIAAVHGITLPESRSWDLLRAVRIARGESSASFGGPSMDRLCRANFLPGKNGSGVFAPILWQQGKVGQVIDYCLNDVIQTKKLVELVIAGRLRDPDNGRVLTNIVRPEWLALAA